VWTKGTVRRRQKKSMHENRLIFQCGGSFSGIAGSTSPERLAIVGEPREVTYGELSAFANRAGNALR